MPTCRRPVDHSRHTAARSWPASTHGPGIGFAIQNLPLGVLSRAGSSGPWRGAEAIGDQAIDLAALRATAAFDCWPGRA